MVGISLERGSGEEEKTNDELMSMTDENSKKKDQSCRSNVNAGAPIASRD
jgi:hypothetical protein